ncbi:restriction endonuclease [Apilactobacillus apisilvae]|uniref:Restriction endonuclease n=1 Tax=Apilactobacillus apisilvae TaxID=2923364 RepID=A0ABY4PG13_9LACO|nr:restriction endonuclease [Apilactobacillus apisilvae]UQS84608.1 restriction endonuclease [Apilactobacillus apisilvae]
MKILNIIRRCLCILIFISMLTGIIEFKVSPFNLWITQLLSIFTSVCLIYVILPSNERKFLKTIIFNITGRKNFTFKVKYNQSTNLKYDDNNTSRLKRNVFFEKSNQYNQKISELINTKQKLEENIESMNAYKNKLNQEVTKINSVYQELHILQEQKKQNIDEISKLKEQKINIQKSTEYHEFIEYKAKNELKNIDELDGYQFEKYTYNLLNKLGFQQIKITKGSNDYGIDILAKNGETSYGFQCKLYSSPIGIKAIQEVSAGIEYYKCKKAVVITNSYFTPNAITAGKALEVDLWNRDKLLELLKEINE